MVLLIAALLLLLAWMLWPKRPRVPGGQATPYPGSRPQVQVCLTGPDAPPAGLPTCSTGVLPDQLTEDDLIAFGLALESIDDVTRDRDADER